MDRQLVECLRDNLVEKTQSLEQKLVLLANVGGALPFLVACGEFWALVMAMTMP